MDTMENAKQLKALLCIHDEAISKIQHLESIQKELDQRLFQASVTGQNEFQRQYLLRLSVIEGYQYMVKCYRRKVWSRVLELSNLILQTSPGEAVTVLPESPTRRLVIDRMAQPETENFCQMYRSQ
ncbi:uncharacterized protein LOC128188221 [Crassostrea angulata]|uniref:uncharacterized protein LOC128188221 n=1 Tax=Magallana angulata TaxID=2784310 RepID=UPI0022B0B4DE|nr:uncharacterized protein LOC128188221 [Crassostrea angulata]